MNNAKINYFALPGLTPSMNDLIEIESNKERDIKKYIEMLVAVQYKMHYGWLSNGTRKNEYVEPKKMFCYLMRIFSREFNREIAQIVGLTRPVVIYHIRTLYELAQVDISVNKTRKLLITRINQAGYNINPDYTHYLNISYGDSTKVTS